MFENDYTWLLKTMSTSATNINNIYNLNVKIPEIILMKNGEPRIWFYQEKDQIKTRNENYLKLRFVKEYFTDPQAANDPQLFDFDYMYNTKQVSTTNDPHKILFCVAIENSAKEIKVIKKITKRVADELLANVQENMEYCKQWTKIFSYFPTKNNGLFEVSLTQGLKDEKAKLKITKKDFSLQDITLSDFSKQDTRRSETRLFPKNDKMLSDNNFSSLASSINTVIEKTIKCFARFLEAKTKLRLGEINLEMIVDSSFTVWLIGSKGIYFYNEEGELDKDTEKENLDFPKVPMKQFFICPGSYCNFSGETNFQQEGDEATNLYENKKGGDRKEERAQTHEIPYKSIILDIIERSKHVDRLQSNFPDYEMKQILQFVDANPFEFRKYYSIGEILQSYLFAGYRVSNMYDNVRVCHNCNFIYEKTDGYRMQNILKPHNRKLNREEAAAALEKFFERPPPGIDKQRKGVFSKAFYKKLKNFDKSILDILGLERTTLNVDNFFELSPKKMRKLSPVTSRSQGFYSKSVATSPQSIKFPTVNKEVIVDSDNIVSREKLKVFEKGKAEVIGYKHYLGHAHYLADSGAGYALSKSSIRLNRLQDKLNRFNFVLENAIEIAETENDSQDHTVKSRLEPIDEDAQPRGIPKRVKELQLSTQTSPRRKSSFNVAVDKLDFYSDKEKAALFEKENKKKEKETQQKKFLATHNSLAKSICGIPSAVNKKNSMPKIVFNDVQSPVKL